MFEENESRVAGHQAAPDVELPFPTSETQTATPPEPVVVIEPTVLQAVGDDETAEDIGRSGRVAARLEKSLPDLVESAIDRKLTGMVDGFLAALGYFSGISPELRTPAAGH